MFLLMGLYDIYVGRGEAGGKYKNASAGYNYAAGGNAEDLKF